MALQGALMCTFGPFVSVLAVRAFGLGDAGYAAVMVTSTLVSVAAALYSGIRADQTANRRAIALFSGGVVVAGVLAMTFLPSTISFVLAHALLLPANSLFTESQHLHLFAGDISTDLVDGYLLCLQQLQPQTTRCH